MSRKQRITKKQKKANAEILTELKNYLKGMSDLEYERILNGKETDQGKQEDSSKPAGELQGLQEGHSEE